MKDHPKQLIITALLLALLTFVLGVHGFSKLADNPDGFDFKMRDAPVIEVPNQTLRLFFANGDFREVKQGSLPWSLHVAPFTAFATVFFLMAYGVTAILRQWSREQRLRSVSFLRVRPTAVIFNLPDNLRCLIPELRSLHRRRRWGWTIAPVVVVLPDRESPLAKACERAGLWVIEATPFDNDFPERTGIATSPAIYIFGESSIANLDLALLCQRHASKNEHIIEIHVEIEDPDVRYALQPQPIGDRLSRAAVLPFSLPVNSARRVLRGGLLATLPFPAADPAAVQNLKPDGVYVLFGSGKYVRAFCAEIIKNSVIDLERHPILHVLCPDADKVEARFHAEIPEWEKLHALLEFHEVDDTEPEGHLIAVRRILPTFVPADVPWNFFCLLPDDGDNISLAARLVAEIAAPANHRGLAGVSRILFLAREAEAFGQSFKAHSPETGPFLEPIGGLKENASLSEIARADILPLATEIDRGYRRAAESDVENLARAISLPALQKLPVVKREQNLAQADHIDIKLAALGLRPSAHEDPGAVLAALNRLLPAEHRVSEALLDIRNTGKDEGKIFRLSELDARIQDLVKLEHLRWMQTHILAGFRHRPRTDEEKAKHLKFDDIRRQHDCLVPFSDPAFPMHTVQFDFDAILILPHLLAVKHGKQPARRQAD